MRAEEFREVATTSIFSAIKQRIEGAASCGKMSTSAKVDFGLYPMVKNHFEAEGFKVEVDKLSCEDIYEGFWLWKRKTGIRYIPEDNGTIFINISWGGKDEC